MLLESPVWRCEQIAARGVVREHVGPAKLRPPRCCRPHWQHGCHGGVVGAGCLLLADVVQVAADDAEVRVYVHVLASNVTGLERVHR